MQITSATHFLAEPQDEERIPLRTLGYVSEATRDTIYDFIIQRFLESGLTKAGLARRLGKDVGQISRTLGAPGNWTIDTCAELLFGIDGSVLTFGSTWPLRERASNMRGAMCISFDDNLPNPPAAATPSSVQQYERPIFALGTTSGRELVE